VNWDIFRAYDIRGVYPNDLDEEAYYRIAKAYTYLFHPTTIVVGRMRVSRQRSWQRV